MESAAYFLEKAAQCRRLARFIYKDDDTATVALLALAEEFDAKAATYTAQDKASQLIAVADDVASIKPEDN